MSKASGEKKARNQFSSVSARSRMVICLCSKAFMLPSEPAGLDSNQTHQCSSLTRSRAVSLCLPNKTKCSYQAERRRQLLVLSDESRGLGLGFAYFTGWFNYKSEVQYGATCGVWNKNSHAAILFTWGDDARMGDTHTSTNVSGGWQSSN